MVQQKLLRKRETKQVPLMSKEEENYRRLEMALATVLDKLDNMTSLVDLLQTEKKFDWNDERMISQTQLQKAVGLGHDKVKHLVDTGFFVAQDYIQSKGGKNDAVRFNWGQVKAAIKRYNAEARALYEA